MKHRVVDSRYISFNPLLFMVVSCLLTVALFFSSSPCRAANYLPAELLYARGSEAYARQSYQEASDYFSQAAVIAPERADLKVALGQCYLALNKYQQAHTCFQQALGLDPATRDIFLYLGIATYCLGDYERALSSLHKAQELDPEKGLISYYQGLCELQLQNPQKSRQEFQEGYRLSPEFASYFKPYEEILLTPEDVRIKKFRQEFALGFNYDSNVELHTRPYYLSPGRKAPKYTDWAGIVGDRTEYFPYITDDANFGFRVNVYDNKHLYLESWDYLNFKGETLLNWRVGEFILNPFFKYDRTWYSGIPFTTFYTYGLTVGWPETDFLKGEVTYQARDRNFWYPRGSEYEESGWDHRVDFAQGILFPGYGIIRLSLYYDRDLAEGAFWASQTFGTAVQGAVFLPWNITGWLDFEYGYTRFNEVDGWWGKRQQNNNFCLQLLFKKPLNKRFALWYGYGYANTRSNIPEWQYNRSLFQVQLTWNLY